MTVPVQRTALLMPRSEATAITPSHTITTTITSPQKAPPVPDSNLTSGYVILAGATAYIPAVRAVLHEQAGGWGYEAGGWAQRSGV